MKDIHSVIMSHMATYIHARRHELGMSLEDVAKRARSTKAHIWSLEHGKSSNPTLGLILALCEALQCDMSTLMASPVSLPTGQTVLALEKAVGFIESLTADPLLLPDDIEMTLEDVQRHARIELSSIKKLTYRHAIHDDRKFDTARNVTEDEIRQWASTRADDAGYLARQLVSLWTPPPETKMEGWQPIETAPTDGRDLIMTSTDWNGDILVGSFAFGKWRENPSPEGCSFTPTHWMPIPPMPEASTDAG